MLPSGLASSAEVFTYYESKYHQLVDTGNATPFIYPLATFGTFFVFLYLLIDHRSSPWGFITRSVVFALYTAFQAWCLLTNQARNPASAYGIGIVSAFSWAWVTVHLMIYDCQSEYKRLALRKDKVRTNGRHGSSGTAMLYWQGYPDGFLERLHWVIDMFISFRGVGWNWQTGGVPDLPKRVSEQLACDAITSMEDQTTVSKTGIRRMTNRRQLVQDCLLRVMVGYLILDALKTFTTADPYFWGYTDAPSPSFYPQIVQDSPALVGSVRLVTTMLFTSTALYTIFKLGPICFAGFLGPEIIGLPGEPWMNPADMFGPFTNVFEKGLAGFWGGFWHQVFRHVFEAPGTRLLEVLQINKKSTAGKLIGLAVAFTISGSIHACGSYTQQGDTRPIRGPFTFFILQGVGIAIETLLWDTLKAAGIDLPRMLKRALNFIFAATWLLQTGPLMCDDFARGGVWLFEPVPFSLFRFFGLGAADARWLCWDIHAFSWHTSRHWYETGLAL